MSIFDTRSLIQVTESLLPNRPFLTDNFSTEGQTFLSKKIDVQFRKGQRLTAPYVNPLLPGKVMLRTGFTQTTYEPALIKPMRPITVIDIEQAGYGETVYSTKSPEQRADEILVQDMIELNDYIARRKEVMLSEAIFEGKVTQIGDGVDQVLDFGFTNNETLATAAQWDKDTSNPFGDLQRWIQKVQRQTGKVIRKVLMAQDVANAFVANVQVQEYFDLRRAEFGLIAPRYEINGSSYFGTVKFPGVDVELYSYNEIYIENYNEDGTQKLVPEVKEIIPSGMIALVPDEPLFKFNYAAITLTNPVTNGFVTYEGQVVPQSWINIDPAMRFLQMNSKPIPIPENVEGWFVAQVITPTAVEQEV